MIRLLRNRTSNLVDPNPPLVSVSSKLVELRSQDRKPRQLENISADLPTVNTNLRFNRGDGLHVNLYQVRLTARWYNSRGQCRGI